MMLFKLKDIMLQRGISQNRLAKVCGWKRQYVQQMANQQPPKVNAATIEKLCAALDCQPGDLLEYFPDEPAPAE
jgi:putative transcriptional regulator